MITTAAVASAAAADTLVLRKRAVRWISCYGGDSDTGIWCIYADVSGRRTVGFAVVLPLRHCREHMTTNGIGHRRHLTTHSISLNMPLVCVTVRQFLRQKSTTIQSSNANFFTSSCFSLSLVLLFSFSHRISILSSLSILDIYLSSIIRSIIQIHTYITQHISLPTKLFISFHTLDNFYCAYYFLYGPCLHYSKIWLLSHQEVKFSSSTSSSSFAGTT